MQKEHMQLKLQEKECYKKRLQWLRIRDIGQPQNSLIRNIQRDVLNSTIVHYSPQGL